MKKSIRAGASRNKSTARATASALALPRGKAKTAYELLERVCAAIKAEPKRYDQTTWGIVGKREIAGLSRLAPACGTVGCRAGWIVALHDGRKALARMTEEESDSFSADAVPMRANKLLGLEHWDTKYLFDYAAVCGIAQTREHANDGVKGLRDFMKQHRTHLKARSLKGV